MACVHWVQVDRGPVCQNKYFARLIEFWHGLDGDYEKADHENYSGGNDVNINL